MDRTRLRRINSMHFIFNEKYEFTPWVVSHWVRPTPEIFEFIYKYIEDNSKTLLELAETAPNIHVAAHKIVREAIKHKHK